MKKSKEEQSTPKASIKATGAKKVSRRKRKTTASPTLAGLCDIDQIYKLINRVQISRETAVFTIKEDESLIVENILKDLELPFKKKKAKVSGLLCFDYTVNPGKERIKTDHLDDIEDFPDEIMEDGQVFF